MQILRWIALTIFALGTIAGCTLRGCMTDAADKSAPLEIREREDSIKRQQELAAAHETPFEIEGTRVCLDCFEPIPKARLRANSNAVRCTECQADHDRRHALGRT